MVHIHVNHHCPAYPEDTILGCLFSLQNCIDGPLSGTQFCYLANHNYTPVWDDFQYRAYRLPPNMDIDTFLPACILDTQVIPPTTRHPDTLGACFWRSPVFLLQYCSQDCLATQKILIISILYSMCTASHIACHIRFYLHCRLDSTVYMMYSTVYMMYGTVYMMYSTYTTS